MIKRATVMGFLGAAVIVCAASVAWGCTVFSMVNLSATAGPAGMEVAVKGTNAAANGPVTLRWDSRTSAPVATATADATGSFSVPVRIPATTPGVHVLLATDSKGSVARGAFQVTTGAVSDNPSAVATPLSLSPANAAGAADPSRWFAVGAAILGIGLMAMVPLAGIALIARRRPVPAPVRFDGER